ncbi:hypothetical protein OAH97_01675 [Octadecabacter sp.]|nr:hypothetical protein [Octadecabacter sp.]
MSFASIDLENFDDGVTPEPEESAEFKLGFEAGQAEALESNAAALTHATEAISATLADMAFGYTEARVMLLNRVRPLLAQVADVVLPQIAQDSFAAHLVEVLFADFETATTEPIRITLNPIAIKHVSSALSEVAENFVFVADTALTDGQALLENAGTEIMIDLPALSLALHNALNGLETLKRSSSHG